MRIDLHTETFAQKLERFWETMRECREAHMAGDVRRREHLAANAKEILNGLTSEQISHERQN
jgi:hypothetical protein